MKPHSSADCAEIITELPELPSRQTRVLYSERLATVTSDELRGAAKRLLARENRH